MWWLVIIFLGFILFAYSRKEGVDDTLTLPEDPSIRELLQSNERLIEDLTKKVDALAPLVEEVETLKRRIDESNAKVSDIADMCVKCTA